MDVTVINENNIVVEVDQGKAGPQGPQGDAATVDVGTTTTGAPGTSASVVNSGTTSAAIFDFTIPQGDTGATGPQGDPGDAATIAAGTTTTSAPGTSASVVNSGTSSAAVFDFTIPQGAGVNSGGTIGQVLAKASATDYDTTWITLETGGDVTGPASATDNAIARYDGTTGKLLQNSPLTISDGGEIAGINDAAFNTAPATIPTAPGSLYWDNADSNQTLSLVMAGGNAVQQIGEEIYYRVKASSAITNGQSVMVTGSVGASGGLLAAPASGLTANNGEHLIGVATEDIALNGWGYVTQFGLVRNINTTGASVGETWADGDNLYYNPAYVGGLTKSVPIAPTAIVEVAEVVHAHASNGSLFIRITVFPRLNQLANVYAPSPNDNDLLQWSAANNRWQETSNLTLTGTLTIDSTTDSSSTTTGSLQTDGGAGIVKNLYVGGNALIGTATNTNSSSIVANGTISETVSGTQYLVASQYDIGTAPNEIPLNQYLGSAAYVDIDYFVTPTATQTLTNKTVTNIVFDGSMTEEVFTLGTSGSLALNPANGTVQTCAASATVTFTDSLSAGQSIVLRLTNGASYTINWPTTNWVTSAGNTAPTLTANDTLVFWKISTTLYGAYVGSGA